MPSEAVPKVPSGGYRGLVRHPERLYLALVGFELRVKGGGSSLKNAEGADAGGELALKALNISLAGQESLVDGRATTLVGRSFRVARWRRGRHQLEDK